MNHYDALVAGTFAGIAQTITGHPLDTIKVNQVAYNQTFLQSVREIQKRGGLRSFYRGLQAPMYTGVFMNMTTYYSYERLRRDHQYSPFQAGALTGALLAIIEAPSDMIKSRMQIGSKQGYVQVFKDVGITRVYRGYGITLTRNIPSVGGYFWGYHLVRERVENRYLGGFLGGSVAGFMCWAPTYPLDYLKTQMQTGLREQTLFQIVKRTPLKDYYRGFGPCVIRSVIVNPFVFLAYEIGLSIMKAVDTN